MNYKQTVKLRYLKCLTGLSWASHYKYTYQSINHNRSTELKKQQQQTLNKQQDHMREGMYLYNPEVLYLLRCLFSSQKCHHSNIVGFMNQYFVAINKIEKEDYS